MDARELARRCVDIHRIVQKAELQPKRERTRLHGRARSLLDGILKTVDVPEDFRKWMAHKLDTLIDYRPQLVGPMTYLYVYDLTVDDTGPEWDIYEEIAAEPRTAQIRMVIQGGKQ